MAEWAGLGAAAYWYNLWCTGTDEAAIINLIIHRDNVQRQQIRQKFKLMYGKVGTCF